MKIFHRHRRSTHFLKFGFKLFKGRNILKWEFFQNIYERLGTDYWGILILDKKIIFNFFNIFHDLSKKKYLIFWKKQGSRSARWRPQSMTWDECKVYKNGKDLQCVQ